MPCNPPAPDPVTPGPDLPALGGFMPALAALLLLLGCEGNDRVAGTSTSVGTSIGGTALLADGSPAAGASVLMRSGGIVFRDGKPQTALVDSTVADARGRFRLSSHPGGFSVEVRCGGRSACMGDSISGVFLKEFPAGTGGAATLGTLRLAAPGALRGSIRDSSWPLLGSDSVVWVGIEGTGNFMKVERPVPSAAGTGKGTFRLDGLYPGEYLLTLIHGPGASPVSLKMRPIPVGSGEVAEAGAIGP
ncbi:MAG: hypothetical protein JWP91_3680 [Fibrobacteres bacterium]|nr:hypothetical protein [Fibrobacterota bacterium]